jgi:serine protease Do
MARRIMEDLIFDGKVSRGWLGVSIQELDQPTRDAFGLSAEAKGVLIGDVFKGQPADKAGIKRGDVITKVNDRPIETLNQLRNQVAAIHPGKTVPVEILRNGKKQTVHVKVTSRDESAAQVSSSDAVTDQLPAQSSDAAQLIGFKVGALTNEVREQLGLAKGVQGVVVTEVARGSQAAQEGLKPNDIILEVNRKQVPNVKDFNQAVKGVKAGDPILFLIQRDGNTFYRAFKIRK